jgi:hypothetical protein
MYFDFHTEILRSTVNGWSTFKVVNIKHIKQAYQNCAAKGIKLLLQESVKFADKIKGLIL